MNIILLNNNIVNIMNIMNYKYIFPKIIGVDYSKLKLSTEGAYSITRLHEGKQIADIVKRYVCSVNNLTLTDGTVGCGGDVIHIGNLFNSVIGIEKNYENYLCAKNNFSVLGVECELLNLDIIKYMKNNKCDVLWLDPPWGGKDYYTHDNLELYLSKINIKKLISTWIDKCGIIFVKIPKNYNMYHIEDRFIKFDILNFKGEISFLLLMFY